jgi:hypothetical protein
MGNGKAKKPFYKRIWFIVLCAIIGLGAIGNFWGGNATSDSSGVPTVSETSSPPESSEPVSLPAAVSNTDSTTLLNVVRADYIGRIGLEVFKELQQQGYALSADFENDALTQINGNAGELFEKTDLSDLASVDAFVVEDVTQDGDKVHLTIKLQPTAPDEEGDSEVSEDTLQVDTSTDMTTGQSNALGSAREYLEFKAFSYSGLIGQLEYEGYSTEEATFAADNCGADWSEQAAKSAIDYLEFSSFSYTGLIAQLEYEGYTTAEATHGADNCGADWNEQAAKKAKEYLDYSSFSRSGLIDQLVYEGFTAEQAEYGASANGY